MFNLTLLLQKLGHRSLCITQYIGDCCTLTWQALCLLFCRPWQGKHIVYQLYAIGFGSIGIIVITAAFTGMVLAIQGYYTLAKFGSESLLGSATALSLIRELGPVLAALMFTGRAGSSITAEIGMMRSTEQLDALEMMAVNPKARVLMPRIVACLLATPLLTAFFCIVGMAAAYVIGVQLLDVNAGAFIHEMQNKVVNADLQLCFLKASFFGLYIGMVCVWFGYRAEATTEGVGRATTKAVVISSIGILIIDYIVSAFFI